MKNIRDFFSFLAKSWIYILLFAVSFLLFVRLYLPDDLLIKLFFDSVESQTGVTIKTDTGRMIFIPRIGVNFDSAVVTLPNSSGTLNLGETSMGISFFSLLVFSPSFHIKTASFNGMISASASGLPMNPSKTADEVDLDIKMQSVNLKELNLKTYIPINLAALADGTIEGRLNLMNPGYSVLKMDFVLSDIKITDSNIMGYSLPSINLKKGGFNGTFDKSNLNISKLALGSGSEDLDLFISGQVKLKFNNPYEGRVRLKLGGVLDTQFSQFLNMSLAETRGTDGYYSFRIKGDMRTFPPQIVPER